MTPNTFTAQQQYKQNSVLTATPGELTLHLYNGLVRFIKMSISAMEQENFQEANVNLLKSQDIIRELLCTLNMSYEISKNMAAMYEYMLERLIHANIHKDRAAAEEVLGFAEEFRSTWYQITKKAK
jgi:flagellar protein FliS